MYILLLGTNFMATGSFCQTTDTYFATIQKVTTLMQMISGKIVAESANTATRSCGLSTDYYYAKMIEGLEEEVATIIGDKNNEDLSQEEKEIIQMLEMYLGHLKSYFPGNTN